MKFLVTILALTGLVRAACVPVEGDRIRGRELAVADAAFAGVAPDADVAPAPLAGMRRVLPPLEVERLARRWGVDVGPPRQVCFERVSRLLDEVELLQTLEAALEGRARVELVDHTRTPVPLGHLEFTREGLDASGLWRGRVVYGDHRSVPVWARVRVSERETGRPIAIWRVPEEPLVERGDPVEVEVRSGGVRLAFRAAAESGGRAGEAVLVRNPASGQRFRAVVEARGKVGIQK